MIDIFNHFTPAKVYALFKSIAPDNPGLKAFAALPALWDIDARLKLMEQFGDFQQVLSLSNPPIELLAGENRSPELAKIANDELAAVCRQYPHWFPAFTASMPANNPDAAVREAERAIKTLGARGIQLFTNVNGKPIDAKEYEPLFALAAEHDLPIWLHPTRTADFPDYTTEKFSRYEMWWCFGWPYETSVAMARLVLTGLFDRYPRIKIITHHGGGMIPFYDKRIEKGLASLGGRTKEEDYSGVLSSLKRPFMDYFHDFYADTALFGDSLGLDCALKFFGVERMVFASDAPFGPIKLHTDAIDARDFEKPTRDAITKRNAEKLMKMSVQ